jgi:DNA repair exonuclease SbcCD ATPase subunit
MTRKRSAKAIAEYENAIIVEEISAAVADGSRVNHTRIAALLPHLPKTTIGPRIQRLRKRVKCGQAEDPDVASTRNGSDTQDAESARLLLSVSSDSRVSANLACMETELDAALKQIQRLKEQRLQDIQECDQLRLELSEAIWQVRLQEEQLDQEGCELNAINADLANATRQIQSMEEYINRITIINREEVDALKQKLVDKQSIISRLVNAIQYS